MSFFDNFKDIGGGDYISSAEKIAMTETGIPFQIVDVVYQEESRFGERFVVRIVVPDPETGDTEERLMSFGAGQVDSRDRLLRALMEWLAEADNEPPTVKLTKSGQSYLIERADA